MLDLYCERLGPGLAAEPLNTLSNAAFLFAAWLAWRRHGTRTDVRALATMLAAIGLGSTLFHMLATTAAQLCDVVPIVLFELTYLWLYLRRVAALQVTTAVAWLAVFGLTLITAGRTPALFNGSLGYVPAALALIALGVLHLRRDDATRMWLLAASALFLLSLTARTFDLALCPRWPHGTHFLWHSLNAVVLYLLIAAYARRAELLAR